MSQPFAPQRGRVLAMVAYPYDPSIVSDVPATLFPTGVIGYPDLITYEVPGMTTTIVAASEGFTSRPGDSPPHRWFAPLLSNAFSYAVSLFQGLEPGLSSRGPSGGGGAIEIVDPEGRLDAAVALGWDGRVVEIWRGARGAAFASFERVARLTSDGWTGLNRRSKSIRIRDNQARLYNTPLVAATYAGTGGIDGDAAIKGKLKPQSYGWVFNVEPVVIDTANLVLAWHDRAVNAVLYLRVGGVAWTNKGDHATYAALVAATLTNGEFATCNALGIVRLGAVPAFPVRIEGEGDKHGGVFVQTRGQIAQRLATTRGMLPIIDPDEIDTDAFTAMDTAQPDACGWHWNQALTIGQALDEIMAGVAGWWDVGLDGMLRVQQLAEPAETAELVIDCAAAALAGEPAQEEWLAPRSKTRVGWQRNYAPQDNSQLTGSAQASAAEQRLYREEWRYAEIEDPSVRTLYPTAREVFVAANFKTEAAAQTEAVRQQALFGVKRARWNFPVHIDPFAEVRNVTADVQNWQRYDFGASKKFRCVGIAAGADQITATLSLWG